MIAEKTFLSQITHRNLVPVFNSMFCHRSSTKSPTERIMFGNLRFPMFYHKMKGTEKFQSQQTIEENEQTATGREGDEGLPEKNVSTLTKMVWMAEPLTE